MCSEILIINTPCLHYTFHLTCLTFYCTQYKNRLACIITISMLLPLHNTLLPQITYRNHSFIELHAVCTVLACLQSVNWYSSMLKPQRLDFDQYINTATAPSNLYTSLMIYSKCNTCPGYCVIAHTFVLMPVLLQDTGCVTGHNPCMCESGVVTGH